MNEKFIQKKVKKLASKFWGGRPWYQCIDFTENVSSEKFTIGNKARLRTESFSKSFPQFINTNDRILDIGCNAGLFTLEAAQICNYAVGLEIDNAFYKQAIFVKQYFDFQGKRTDNVEILKQNILKKLDIFSDITVVFASKVLYHKNIGDGVFEIMDAIVNSPVRLILAQGHTTQGERGQNEGMGVIFNKYGFSSKVIVDVPEYPIVIGERFETH